MKRKYHHCPSLEVLESRWCPSATARVNGEGTLFIKGSSDDLEITQTAAGSFAIIDDGTDLGTFSGVDRLHVMLRGGSAVAIDLGGFVDAIDRVFIQLGQGDNELSILNGSIGGSLTVHGGNQTDLIDVASSVSVGGNLNMQLFGGNDIANVAAVVAGRTMIHLGNGNDELTYAGSTGNGGSGQSTLLIQGGNGQDTVTLAAAAALDGNGLIHLGNGNDTLVVEDRPTPLAIRAHGDGGQDTFQGDQADLSVAPINFEVFQP